MSYRKEDHEPIPGSEVFSFCESVVATGTSPWHIRRLDAAGQKFGGGVTTPSLCKLIEPGRINGWDLEVKITLHHLGHTCQRCRNAFEQELHK